MATKTKKKHDIGESLKQKNEIIKKHDGDVAKAQKAIEEEMSLERAIAKTLDGQPYDRVRVVNETKFYIAQSVVGIVEAGKRLLVLQAKEKGSFQKLIEEELEMSVRSAYRFMGIAKKVESVPTLAHFSGSKIDVLMSLPDEELEKMEEEGVLLGKPLKDMTLKSVRELKEEVKAYEKRWKKAEAEKEKVKEELHQSTEEITELKKREKGSATDRHINKLHDEAHSLLRQLCFKLNITRDAIEAGIHEGICSEDRASDHRGFATILQQVAARNYYDSFNFLNAADFFNDPIEIEDAAGMVIEGRFADSNIAKEALDGIEPSKMAWELEAEKKEEE